ncbi:MAG: uL15 family ribosomal protein [Patescibacteria group bacterium]
MDLHNLKPKTIGKNEKRIGRGGKRGTTSGRGTKGQKSRAGHRIRPAVRDLMRKIPKARGSSFKSFKRNYIPVELSILDKNFNNGEKVTPKTLRNKGIIVVGKGVSPKVKVLDGGSLSKKLILENLAVSRKAASKILAAGGEIRALPKS